MEDKVRVLQGVVHGDDARSELPGGIWEQHLTFTELNGVRYLEEGNGRWHPRGNRRARSHALTK
ncbi:MAG TPA: hypothetical protein VFV96_14385 [Verrucomicrobiae bacterium]|nr:hypothetical protein [Verrucomicrobiae bacterium]